MRRAAIAIALLVLSACGDESEPECYVWPRALECVPCDGRMWSNWIPGGYEYYCETWLDDGGTRSERCTLSCLDGPPDED